MDNKEFLVELKKRYEDWMDKRYSVISKLMGGTAHSGIIDLLKHIDPEGEVIKIEKPERKPIDSKIYGNQKGQIAF